MKVFLCDCTILFSGSGLIIFNILVFNLKTLSYFLSSVSLNESAFKASHDNLKLRVFPSVLGGGGGGGGNVLQVKRVT